MIHNHLKWAPVKYKYKIIQYNRNTFTENENNHNQNTFSWEQRLESSLAVSELNINDRNNFLVILYVLNENNI
jgi:hypothetical protein